MVLLGLAALVSPASLTQSRWTLQNPYPTFLEPSKVAFVDSSTACAVGEAGVILRTTNCGTTWSALSIDSLSWISDVVFCNADTGYAAAGNWVLATTDGGLSWSTSWTGRSSFMDVVAFFDARTGFAAGYGNWVLRTTDAGTTWAARPRGWSEAPVGTAIACTESVALVAGGPPGFIVRSTDRGMTWSNIHLSSTDDYRGGAYGGAGRMIIVGNTVNGRGIVMTSVDTGRSWTRQEMGNGLSDVALSMSGIGIAIGGPDTVFRTTDAGMNWTRVPILNPSWWLNGVSMNEKGLVLAAGSQGTILRSVDAGLIWSELSYGQCMSSNGVCFTDELNGTAVGGGDSVTIVRTTNRGMTWLPVRKTSPEYLFDIAFASPDTGIAVGSDGLGGRILRTTNGGADWSVLTNAGLAVLYGVCFADYRGGFAVGDAGTIIATSDAGSHWTPRPSAATKNLNGISFCGPDVGIIVGGEGTILRTTDGGATWVRLGTGIAAQLKCVLFLDRDTIIVGGDGVYRTTDGGISWKTSISPPPKASRRRTIVTRFLDAGEQGIFATAASRIAHGESYGTIYHSNDAGATWVIDTVLRGATLSGIARCGSAGYTVVGDRGAVMYMSTGTSTEVDPAVSPGPAVPPAAVLEQNYPNPFNSSTSIVLQVSAGGLQGSVAGGQSLTAGGLRLAIYDVLGREVAVLVNDRKAPGSYEVRWDATGVPSGMYICRLSTARGSVARKMILMK
jgi:photosystem II stability/assembly factor-like uncharacterized protein